jgi:pimeloyl-ACP methyl ester carboxylesterase
MLRHHEIFDRSRAVRRPPYRWLVRELWARAFSYPSPPDPAEFPPGNGHIVLVVPAFLTTDLVTRHLRRFLTRCGYRVFGWGLGVNWGPTPRILAGLRRQVHELAALERGPIGLIGVSLGGVLARDVAHASPQHIRHVVTLVSPFRLPTASTIEPLVHLFAPFYSRDFPFARVGSPLPMSSTAVFSRQDGVVAWESCMSEEPRGLSVEVRGPHMSICRNPQALRITAQRLAAYSG